MRPDDRELDEEIRGHLALSVKERIENGEHPEAARLAAMREFHRQRRHHASAEANGMTLIPLHVIGGAIAIVSGFVALYALKGAQLHRTSGTIFVYAMLVMLAAFALSLASIVSAFVSAGRGNTGFVFPLLIFGVLARSAGVGDRRMLRAGGLQGTARLKRHLWRMCAALFITAASFFPVRRIPEPLRIPALHLVPLVVLVTMVYWLWRFRRKRTSRSVVGVTAPEAI